VFEGVEGYVFYGDALGTILFEIEEIDPLMLYREFADDLRAHYSKNGGHRAWVQNESSAAAFLSRADLRGYRLCSSIGLEGAVWAKRLTVR
jgi:hypothetical protein